MFGSAGPRWDARPKLFGEGRANLAQANAHLKRASQHVERGGGWTDEIRVYVDSWLDVLCIAADREVEALPVANPVHERAGS